MKLVCTGDWHVFNFKEFSKNLLVQWDNEKQRFLEIESNNTEHDVSDIKEMNSRLMNILNGLCDMRDYCVSEDITDILFAGDMFHKRGTIDVVVFNSLYRVLKSFKDNNLQVHAIAGNHDQVDNSKIPVSAIHSFSDVIHVIEQPEYFTIDEQEVVAVPYSKDKEFIISSISDLKHMCKEPKQAILLCHLGITGGTVGSGMYSMKDEYSLKELQYNKWKYLVAGHYHQPQLLEYNSIYTGTPVQNSFGDELLGEDGFNGFFVIDTDKRWDVRFVPIYKPRFITLTAEELENSSAQLLQEHYIRIKSTNDNSEKIQDLLESSLTEEELESSNIRVELEKEYISEHRSEIGISQSFEEIITTYTKEKLSESTSEEQEKMIFVGLDILSRAI